MELYYINFKVKEEMTELPLTSYYHHIYVHS
jgi:hypothetical protein